MSGSDPVHERSMGSIQHNDCAKTMGRETAYDGFALSCRNEIKISRVSETGDSIPILTVY